MIQTYIHRKNYMGTQLVLRQTAIPIENQMKKKEQSWQE